MKNKLSDTWLTDKHIELEYKSYIVMAYLKEVEREFENKRIYPALADLIHRFTELQSLKQSSDNQSKHFRKEITGAQLRDLKLTYNLLEKDESLMDEIIAVINYSMPLFANQIQSGKKLYDDIEEQMNIYPIGILPLHRAEGYFLIPQTQKKQTNVYEYTVTFITSSTEKFRAIRLDYITSYTHNFINTFESIKMDLIRSVRKIANPAVYATDPLPHYPYNESFLPVAKRLLARKIEID